MCIQLEKTQESLESNDIIERTENNAAVCVLLFFGGYPHFQPLLVQEIKLIVFS